MGFPETFKIPVSDTQAYKQFGNSIVVPVVSAVAENIANTLEEYGKVKSRKKKLEYVTDTWEEYIPGAIREKISEPTGLSVQASLFKATGEA
jgi:hypothetical protein